MNISQFSVPRCPSVSRYMPVPSSLAWCTMETMATTLCCPSNSFSVKFHNRQQMTKALWLPKVKEEESKSNLFLRLSVSLSCSLLLPLFLSVYCVFSFSYGQFWGRRTYPVSLSGRGCCDSSTTHSQLPSATSHLVQRWAQDSTQQPHVSFLLLLFFFFLFVGPFVSYFDFLFDSRNTFWGFFFVFLFFSFVPEGVWGL